MPKRYTGEGTAYKYRNGYAGQITVGRYPDGKLNRKTVYGKTAEEVIEKLNKIKKELMIGNYIEPDKTTVYDWVVCWINAYKKIRLKPRTYDSYIQLTNLYIKPNVGQYQMQKLKNTHVQIMYNKLYDEFNLTPSTIKKIHNILKPAFKHAVDEGFVNRNCCNSVQLPASEKKKIKVFTKKEQLIFEDKAKVYRQYVAFIVCLDTGVRRSEILALTWNDVDFENVLLNIDKNLVEVRDYKNGGTKLKIQNTSKTKSSTRVIPLTLRSKKLLHNLKSKREKLSNIIFCNKEGKYMRPRSFSRVYEKIIFKAGIEKCGVHSTRHTFATRLFEIGVPAKTISKLLGHRSVAFTLDTYAHVLPEKKKEAIDMLDEIQNMNSLNIDGDINDENC
jgi:integrase